MGMAQGIVRRPMSKWIKQDKEMRIRGVEHRLEIMRDAIWKVRLKV